MLAPALGIAVLEGSTRVRTQNSGLIRLDSLPGSTGPAGPQGNQGEPGEQGAPGQDADTSQFYTKHRQMLC